MIITVAKSEFSVHLRMLLANSQDVRFNGISKIWLKVEKVKVLWGYIK